MPTPKKGKPSVGDHSQVPEYRGKQTKTGNSSGFRFEGALFKSHPEFNGEVRARVIAPGRMLVVAETGEGRSGDGIVSRISGTRYCERTTAHQASGCEAGKAHE